MVEDINLIKRIKKDDGKAFEKLFKRYFAALNKKPKLWKPEGNLLKSLHLQPEA